MTNAEPPRRICLTGATGFIGGHLRRGLLADGHTLTCLVRPGQRPPATPPESDRLRVLEGEWTAPAGWLGAVAGHDVVVNAVGIIRERPSATFETVHATVPAALFRAAVAGGVRQIVQLSALGADAGARSAFHRTKRRGDAAALACGVSALVLRPSLVYGPGDHSMRFFARLATLPVTPIPGDGRYRVQPVRVADIVRAVRQACRWLNCHGAFDVGGGTVLTFAALLHRLARRQGRRGARLLHVPWAVMRLVARLTDLTGHGPITSDELAMLRRGSVADNRAFTARFGFAPAPFP